MGCLFVRELKKTIHLGFLQLLKSNFAQSCKNLFTVDLYTRHISHIELASATVCFIYFQNWIESNLRCVSVTGLKHEMDASALSIVG